MEELQEETHATCADARQNAAISGIEAGEGQVDVHQVCQSDLAAER